MARALVVVVLLGLLATASATPLGALKPGCIPAFVTLEPDGYRTWDFAVELVAPPRFWRATYVHPTRDCCEWMRRTVAEVVRHVKDPAARVTVEDTCR